MSEQKEYIQRRQKFLAQLDDESIAIIAAAPNALRNGDTEYAYRQDSYFHYLTGFPESDTVAVFAPNHSEGQYLLFNKALDAEMARWIGAFVGQSGAVEHYAADKSYPIDEFTQQLERLVQGRKRLYTNFAPTNLLANNITKILHDLRFKSRKGVVVPDEIINVNTILDEMRLFKSEYELDLMSQAAKISSNAHIEAMKICRPGMKEYELEALFDYEFKRHGCRAAAYLSIVAGGRNACVLHYTENNQVLNDNELVLVDAGGEYEHYAADITRTFPINGKFTAEQRELYQLVLSAQEAAIHLAKPGVSWERLQESIVEVLTQGLVDLNILKGRVPDLIESKAYTEFYCHQAGHWLGLDVHDVGSYKQNGQWRTLQPNMVFTIEPGLYIDAEQHNVDERWRGIGVRIEDDVVITEQGNKLLSDVPKTIDEIEALMSDP